MTTDGASVQSILTEPYCLAHVCLSMILPFGPLLECNMQHIRWSPIGQIMHYLHSYQAKSAKKRSGNEIVPSLVKPVTGIDRYIFY